MEDGAGACLDSVSLLSVLGAGGFSMAISAIAERDINPYVPAGTSIALKVSREAVPVDHIKNHSLARECMNMVLLEKRLERKEFRDIIPSAVHLWDDTKTGRCCWGHTQADEPAERASLQSPASGKKRALPAKLSSF